MAKDAKKDKKGDDEEEDKGGKCVLSPETMKFLTMLILLCSDFDVAMTAISIISYYSAGGVFHLMIIVLFLFTMVYISGCIVANKEAGMFLERFKDKVRLNEIQGLTMEDLDDSLDGRRIFWMGSNFEQAKKQKASIEQLQAATPDASEPHELDIPTIEMALREAEMAGTKDMKQPGNPRYGKKIVDKVTEKLKAAKKAQASMPKKTLSKRASKLAEATDGVPEPTYDAPPKQDAQGAKAGGVDMNAADDGEGEEDFAAKLFDEEIKAAEAAGDLNLVKMLQLASINQLDSYKVDKKLLNKKGKVTDPVRALFMICDAKGILYSYHSASRAFSRRVVTPCHSVPYYRLTQFGWQPDVSHTDFAGILNANGLYSFTVGLPQLFFSITFVLTPKGTPPLQPCEMDPSVKCTMMADMARPLPQSVVIVFSTIIGVLSLVISIGNIFLDLPAQLFDIAEKDEEALAFTLAAEAATKTWETKLETEVRENTKMMLKMSTQFENNSIPGMEAPGLVIEDVMKLQRRAMEKRVAFIEHYLTMQEDEKKKRADLRKGMRSKKKKEGEEGAAEEEPVAEGAEAPQPVEPAALPPPAEGGEAPAEPAAE